MDELRRTVQALAQDAEVQLALFPDFVCVGDELVMEFGEAFEHFRTSAPTPDGRMAALVALDEHIAALAGSDEAFWWDPVRLRTDPAWARTRELARQALVAFGWSQEVPIRNGAVYVLADGFLKND